MLLTLLYLLLTLIAFSVIIFLHELGHLLAALWVGMTVERFSVGFGRALWRRKYRNIEWQISWIPVGGYVRIKELEAEEGAKGKSQRPSAISSLKKMFVVAMGPFVNIALAWFLFATIYGLGGQLKSFSELNQIVGAVDPTSELARFVSPGDLITSYDGHKLRLSRDHIIAAQMAADLVEIKVKKISYSEAKSENLSVLLAPYHDDEAIDPTWKTLGLRAAAKELWIESFAPINSTSSQSLEALGAQRGDQIVAINGSRVFSDRQLGELLNDGCVLVTYRREGKLCYARVPSYPLTHLSLDLSTRHELSDWRYELIKRGALNYETSLQEMNWLALSVDAEGLVQSSVGLTKSSLGKDPKINQLKTLMKGDKIVAIGGQSVTSGADILEALQKRWVSVVLYRPATSEKPLEASFAQARFLEKMQSSLLETLLSDPMANSTQGPYILLKGAELFARSSVMSEQLENWRRQSSQIINERSRAKAIAMVEEKAKEWAFGVRLKDAVAFDNPSATIAFSSSLDQIMRTLGSLVNGSLSPKYLAGPVGMATAMTRSFSVGIVETLQILAIISLNLGIVNLLPFPIFDGGHLVMNGFELLTRRKVNAKWVETAAYIFLGVLVLITITATYWDLSRLFSLLSS